MCLFWFMTPKNMVQEVPDFCNLQLWRKDTKNLK